MSADLEQLLKTTLGNRADTITSGPQWTGAPAPQRRRPPHWAAALAAAAVVVAVSVGVTVLQNRHQTESAAPPTPAPAGQTCAATLPTAWTDAMRNSAVDLDADNVGPLDVGPDGTVVALRDAGPTPGSARDVVVIPRSGDSRTVYSVHDPDQNSVYSATLSGHWLVIALTTDPRPAKNRKSADRPESRIDQLVAVDLTGHATWQIPFGTATADVHQETVFGGRVYWDERSGGSQVTVRSYGLDGHDPRVEFTGTAAQLRFTPTAVFEPDTAKTIASIPLPAPVSAAVDGNVRQVVTDGAAFAWGDGQRRIGWWQPGMAAPRSRAVPIGTLDYDDNTTGGLSVTGHYVFTEPIKPSVLDMTTGALAPLTDKDIYGGHGRGQFDYYAGGGVTVGAAFYGAGHFVDGYWTEGAQALLRLDLRDLPALSC